MSLGRKRTADQSPGRRAGLSWWRPQLPGVVGCRAGGSCGPVASGGDPGRPSLGNPPSFISPVMKGVDEKGPHTEPDKPQGGLYRMV